MRIAGTLLQQIHHNDPKSKSFEVYKLGCGEVYALCQALKDNKTLTSVTIKKSIVDEKAMQALNEVLKANKTITSLNLEYTQIGVAGARTLSEALKTNRTLTLLNLKWTRIGIKGAQALADALKFNTKLTSLNLWGNAIQDKGVQKVSEALMLNTSVTYLNLYNNKISNEGVRTLGKTLQENITLKILNLGKNRINDVGIQELNRSLKINKTINSIELRDNPVSPEAISKNQVLVLTNTLSTLKVSNDIAPHPTLSQELANEKFANEYVSGNRNIALQYIEDIDVDYNDGYFLIQAAEQGDIETLEVLLDRGAKEGLISALSVAAREGYLECIELLIARSANPISIRSTPTYTTYPEVKRLLDKKIAELEDNKTSNGNHSLKDGKGDIKKKAVEQQEKELDLLEKLYLDRPNPKMLVMLELCDGIASFYESLDDIDSRKKGANFRIKALEISKKFYSEPHSEIAKYFDKVGASFENLDELEQKEENIIQACNYKEQALKIREEIYQDQLHPELAASFNNVGVTYKKLGGAENIEKGIVFQEKSLAMLRHLYSNQPHPYIAVVLDNIGGDYLALEALEKIKKGLACYEEALNIRQQLYGNQPTQQLAKSFDNLADAYERLNEKQEALLAREQALEIRRKLYSD